MKRIFELVDKNFSLSKAFQLFKRGPISNDHPPIITISREYGSGGSVIAKQVAEILGKPWKVYHEEIVDEIAKQAHLEKKLIKEIDEGRLPFVEETIAGFFGGKNISLTAYTKHLIKILSQIGNRGYAIIVGRGANFLFPYSLKIRIVGEMKERLNILKKYLRVSEEKAKKLIEDSDEKRRQFIRDVYNHDPKKAHHYNVVIKTSEYLSPEDAAHMIAEAARRRFKLRRR